MRERPANRNPTTFGALLRVEQLAEYLSLSIRQVWKLAAAGQLPAPVRPPGTRRALWRRAEIDEAIETWSK